MKKIKIIQINIYKGKYLEALTSFLREENSDFITMQEVTTNGFNYYKSKKVNLFELLKKELGMYGQYYGDMQLKGEKDSMFGNAVFSKFTIDNFNKVVLKTFKPLTLDELDGSGAFTFRPQIPRHLLEVQVDFQGVKIRVMSWHGAWTAPPTDTEETIRQAKIVADYLKSLNEPFILGCDLNNTINSKTVGLINEVTNNLMNNSNVKQTTHPKVHKIVPRGFLIDYIFTSEHFKLEGINVPAVTVSDHLPVVAKLTLDL